MVVSGETEDLKIEVERYRVTGMAGAHLLVIERIRASRQWVQLLLEDFVVGKPIPIPSVALVALGGSEASPETGPSVPVA